MAGFVGLKWTDAGGTRRHTKFSWSKGDLGQLIGTASAIALQKAGLEVRKATQRSMVGGDKPTGRVPRKNPQWWRVGEHDGFPVIAYVKKVPRPEKVSSWSPRAFLRNDVQSEWDSGKKSVVIGPSKFPWLNQLHEFGGNVRVYVRHKPYPVTQFGGHKLPRRFQRTTQDEKGRTRYLGAYVGVFNNNGGAFRVGTRKVRGRGYMEIGIQRSINKIPKEFRNTINYGKVRVYKEKGFRR